MGATKAVARSKCPNAIREPSRPITRGPFGVRIREGPHPRVGRLGVVSGVFQIFKPTHVGDPSDLIPCGSRVVAMCHLSRESQAGALSCGMLPMQDSSGAHHLH